MGRRYPNINGGIEGRVRGAAAAHPSLPYPAAVDVRRTYRSGRKISVIHFEESGSSRGFVT
jgi:hypothetical protein